MTEARANSTPELGADGPGAYRQAIGCDNASLVWASNQADCSGTRMLGTDAHAVDPDRIPNASRALWSRRHEDTMTTTVIFVPS
jgi:hypothetical protein